MFDYFCDIYADYLPQGIKEKLDAKEGAVEQFEYLFTECNKTGQRIYLFIDEYDHFTNAILADPESLHRYTNETHGESYLRAFFNKVKAGTYSSIERCFITGVSPVTMDNLTSGFNIGTNYSLSPKFNEMIGFTEEEVRQMLTYYSTTSHFNHTVDELLEHNAIRGTRTIALHKDVMVKPPCTILIWCSILSKTTLTTMVKHRRI